MADTRKKNPKPAKKTHVPEIDGTCDTNIGTPKKGPKKPDCPEGYPTEQPEDKSKVKK